MSPLLKKEIRLLLPAWGVALLLAAVPPWLISHPSSFADGLWIAVVGAVIVAVSAHGREFALGTFGGMLSQPVPRGRLMRTKCLVLFLALLGVLGVYYVSSLARVEWLLANPLPYGWTSRPVHEQAAILFSMHWQILIFGGLGVLLILAGGLWTTLVFRQMVAAFWVTMLVPCALLLILSWLASAFRVQDAAALNLLPLLLYALAALLGAWRLFHNAEDTAFSWGNQQLPSLGALLGRRNGRGAGPRPPIVALVRQELALHQAGLMGAVVLLLLHLGSIGIRASGLIAGTSNLDKILEPIGVFWLLVPLMMGASAIAEERRLGTLEARLCLPVSRRGQFALKCGVAAALGVFLGAGALLLTEMIGRKLGVTGIWEGKDFGAATSLGLAVACLALTCIGIYASSLSRSTLQALGIAVVIALMGFFTINVMAGYNLRFFIPTSWIPGVCWTALFLGMAMLSYRNFGYLHCGLRRVMQNVWIISLSLTMVATLCAGIYYRAWELVMPLEPDHGPARIVGPGQTKIASLWADYKVVILLPDGRLWISSKPMLHRIGFDSAIMLPSFGAFLTTSNWTDMASSGSQTIALRSDGTLWSLLRSELIINRWKLVEEQARQIGNETNWVAVAAGQSHLLALKRSGTLWGWGNNKVHQVCELPEEIIKNPIQIGQDSDWAAVFARRDSTVGVKRDGTSWQWGQVYTTGKDGLGLKNETYTQPTRWDVDLRGVRKFAGDPPIDLLLHEDGTLWAVGQLYYGILGTPIRPHYASEPVEAGGNRRWRDVALTWNAVAGVSEDGRLWMGISKHGEQRTNPLSKYNDWIAVSVVFGESLGALAADGTLTCWATYNGRGPLVPTRRPLTSINIFDAPE